MADVSRMAHGEAKYFRHSHSCNSLLFAAIHRGMRVKQQKPELNAGFCHTYAAKSLWDQPIRFELLNR